MTPSRCARAGDVGEELHGAAEALGDGSCDGGAGDGGGHQALEVGGHDVSAVGEVVVLVVA